MLRQWVLWCLVYALPLQGLSGTLAQWLGSLHLHRGTAVVAAHHHHDHAAPQRHTHALTDASVVALGPDAAQGASEPAAGWDVSGSLIGLGGLARLALREGLSHARPASDAWSMCEREIEPADKPPDGAAAAVKAG